MTSKIIDTIFITVYCPPSTQTFEWCQAVSVILETVELIQANGSYDTIIMSGDFNFPSLKWEDNRPKINIYLKFRNSHCAREIDTYMDM